MATKFPKFSQSLAQDPTTRRLWFGIATAHDFEVHDGMTEEKLYQKIFASHFGQLAIIFSAAAARARPACQRCPTKKKKPNT